VFLYIFAHKWIISSFIMRMMLMMMLILSLFLGNFNVMGQNVVDVQVQVDSVNVSLSQSQFQAALPPNVTVVSYNDANASVATASCMPGFWCAAGSALPTPCAAGTYQPHANQASASACLPCPPGAYCPQNSSTPSVCAAGTYQPYASKEVVGDCLACTAGNYCPQNSSVPTPCAAGTFLGTSGGASCSPCSAGTYDATTLGRTTPCPACAVNSYCLSALSQAPCPANTVSDAGAVSQLQCACVSGYSCTYTKRIAATVTLNNTSLAAFEADTGGVRTNFIATIAAAAGVKPAQVTIVNAQTHISGRRMRRLLLGFGAVENSGITEMIHVTAVIDGAVTLHHHLLGSQHSVVSTRAIHQVRALALSPLPG